MQHPGALWSGYSHPSFWERHQIARLCAGGQSKNAIAGALGRATSTIKRELERNSNKDSSYNPASADRRYLARRQRLALLVQCSDLALFVTERLNENWTPEQISGWLKAGNEKGLRYICHEAIYAWIYARAQRLEKLWRLLPRHKGKRGFRPVRKPRCQPRNIIKDRRSIHQRPDQVNDRPQGGHWEGDLMICRKTPSKQNSL